MTWHLPQLQDLIAQALSTWGMRGEKVEERTLRSHVCGMDFRSMMNFFCGRGMYVTAFVGNDFCVDDVGWDGMG